MLCADLKPQRLSAWNERTLLWGGTTPIDEKRPQRREYTQNTQISALTCVGHFHRHHRSRHRPPASFILGTKTPGQHPTAQLDRYLQTHCYWTGDQAVGLHVGAEQRPLRLQADAIGRSAARNWRTRGSGGGLVLGSPHPTSQPASHRFRFLKPASALPYPPFHIRPWLSSRDGASSSQGHTNTPNASATLPPPAQLPLNGTGGDACRYLACPSLACSSPAIHSAHPSCHYIRIVHTYVCTHTCREHCTRVSGPTYHPRARERICSRLRSSTSGCRCARCRQIWTTWSGTKRRCCALALGSGAAASRPCVALDT